MKLLIFTISLIISSTALALQKNQTRRSSGHLFITHSYICQKEQDSEKFLVETFILDKDKNEDKPIYGAALTDPNGKEVEICGNPFADFARQGEYESDVNGTKYSVTITRDDGSLVIGPSTLSCKPNEYDDSPIESSTDCLGKWELMKTTRGVYIQDEQFAPGTR